MLLLRVGAAVRAAQAGAAVYEERGQRLRARWARRAAVRAARAIVHEALSITTGGLAARPSEPEQLELDLAAATVQAVGRPAEPEAVEGDTVEVSTVVPAATSTFPQLPYLHRDRKEGRAIALPAPRPEPVGIVAMARLPTLEVGAENADQGLVTPADPAEFPATLLDRISAYIRIPAAAG